MEKTNGAEDESLQPRSIAKLLGVALPHIESAALGERLEDQSSAEDNAAVATVRRPLVKKRP